MDETPESIGALIRERRESLGWTQNSLSKRVEISPHTVNHFERGWTRTPDKPIRPQRETVVKLADVLNLNVDSMLDAYGLMDRKYAQFNIAGLTVAEVERVRRFIEDLRARR